MKDRLEKYIARQCEVCGLTYPTKYEGKHFRCPDHLAVYIAKATAKPSTPSIEKVVAKAIAKAPDTHTVTCLCTIGEILRSKNAGH